MHENNARHSILYFRCFFQGALKFQLRVLINAMSARSKNTFENFTLKLRKEQIERMKEEEREEITVDELEGNEK